LLLWLLEMMDMLLLLLLLLLLLWHRRLMLMMLMMLMLLLLLRRPQDRHQVIELLLQLRGSRGRRPLGHPFARRHHLVALFAKAMAAVAFASFRPQNAPTLGARAVGARTAVACRDAADRDRVWRRRRWGHCLAGYEAITKS
jgi:hypothetical protein